MWRAAVVGAVAMNILAELRRRNVIRMAGLYMVVAWLVVQVGETVLPAFDVPGWVLRAMIILFAIGFIPALVFSWVFELTPDGLKRESEIDRAPGPVDHTARKLDVAAITLLLAVGAMVLFKPVVTEMAPDSLPEAGTQALASTDVESSSEPAPAAPASIAVLPFADLSQAGDQGYFSDGMAEEILNVLAKVEGLQVASRTSSFAFKSQGTLVIPAIARELGVRHVLEGSVRRAGGTIRITAQLIDAQTDRHLWSETFDRPLTAENVFAIQDEIAQAIVAALVAALPTAEVGAIVSTRTTTSLGAYDNYLRARALVRSRRQLLLADELLEKSLQQDAQYAPAWELRAGIQILLGEYTDTRLSTEELERRGREFADRALSLAPDSAQAIAAKAQIRSRAAQNLRARHDLTELISDFERSLEIEPDNVDALNWLGLNWGMVGHTDKALEAFQRCVQVDPQASACSENEYDALHVLGRHDEAWQRYLAALDRGAITDLYTNFALLARFGQKAAFVFASNQSRYLPRWRRHEALYEAHRNLEADHSELVGEILAFAEKEGIATDNGYVTLLLLPLGAHDLRPVMAMMWGEDHLQYRQSAQFKHVIRESGVLDYWRKVGYPERCHPVEPDDFRCD
jgi:adenylate cyclase